MHLTLQFDFSSMLQPLLALEHALQDRLLYAAAKDGGEVILDAYRDAVPRYKPPGTFKSAAGQIEHFQQMYQAVNQKVRLFKDKTGAYSIVGIASAPGTHLPTAPQGAWVEEGTGEREHADGSSTGHIEAQHILANVVAQYSEAAQDRALASLQAGVQSVLGI